MLDKTEIEKRLGKLERLIRGGVAAEQFCETNPPLDQTSTGTGPALILRFTLDLPQFAIQIGGRVAELKFILGVIAMRRILSGAALAGVVIFASNGWLLVAANASGSSILEPAAGALLGQYYGAGNLAQTAAKLGRTPPVRLTYYAWTDDWTSTVTKADLAAGRIPLVNWEPHKIDFTKIINGSLDATIGIACKRLQSTWQEVLPRLRGGDEW